MLNDPTCRCTCSGATVWVTGPSTADRLATAYALAERLAAEQRRVEVLDRYDDLRTDTGRTGLLAEVLARNGVVAIVPCAPQSVTAVRDRHAASGTRYVEVSVTARDSPHDTAATMHGLLAGHD
jgi:adenylylsulfate kinase